MNRITYFSFAIIVAYFLPWFDFTFFTVSGFEIPSSLDKLTNINELFSDNKGDDINFTYFLYLIPLLSIINIIGDFTQRKRNIILNEFVVGLISIIYLFYFIAKMEIDFSKIVSIGFIMTILVSLIGSILVPIMTVSNKAHPVDKLQVETLPNKAELFNELEKLHRLKSENVITDEIFEFEKKSLLIKIDQINSQIESDKEYKKSEPLIEENDKIETFFSKYKAIILISTICLIIFSIYYYVNSQGKENEISFEDINKDSENITDQDLQSLAKRHFEKYKIRFETESTTNAYDTTYVGDFTNDGLLDVVLDFTLDPTQGNLNAGGGILLYKNTGSGITFIKEYNPEYLYRVDEVLNTGIFLKRFEYTDDDPRCCPSINKIIKLNVDGENITEEEIK